MNLKIYAQLEKQMLKDGKKSIFKSLRSAKKTLAQHEKKRGIVKFTSQIDKTIFNVKEQIETIEQFIKEKNLIDK
jgi:hypothetical protein